MNYNLIQAKGKRHNFLILYIFCILSMSAGWVGHAEPVAPSFSVLQSGITFVVKNKSIKETFEQLGKITNYVFLYDNEILQETTKININVVNGTIDTILQSLAKQTGLSFQRTDNTISVKKGDKKEVKKTDVTGLQKEWTVTGVVLDDKGEAIIGANVMENGTSNGTVTDLDGHFTLALSGGEKQLLFSYIGYTSKNIRLQNGQSTVNVTLEEDTEQLDEVVIVGYGTQKKVNLTGAISTIKYNKELENRPITDASQALSGKTTGVWVSQNSGAPGSDGATIRVRGYGTLNNSSPLVLIDGVEGRLGELNPGDIASMTVLKDAASAAIYGSRAANGVILIETKKGEGDKVTVNYNGYFGVQQLGRRYDLVSDSPEFMRLWNSAYTNSGKSPLFPEETIQAFEIGNDPYKYPSTNYFDEVFHNAFTTQHNLSVAVGNKKSSTFVSLAYLKNNGIIKNTDSERYSVTLNNETKINKWLTLGARVRLMRKTTNQPYDGIGRVIMMMANGYPFSTPYLQDGKTYGGTQALYLSGDKAGEPIVDTRNPFPDLYNGLNQSTNNFMKGNAFVTINFMEGLTLTAQYNGQFNNNSQDKYNQLAYCYTDLEGGNKTKPLDYPTTLYVYRGVTDEYYSTFFANLNFNRTFNQIHDISGVLGYQQESTVSKTSSAQKTNPPKDNLHQVDAGTSDPIAKGNKTELRMMSYFGRINYALMGKYLVEANLRADASSRFAKGNRWGYFPSFSAGWRLGEEDFIRNMNIFDNLKIRASWGKLGNQNIGGYFPYLSVLTQSNPNSYNFNNVLAPGAAVTGLVDHDITWETTATTDVGLDLGFFNNRLNIESDYFIKNTRDIIVQLPIPSVLGGLTAPYENIGKMKNQGVEVNVNWQDKVESIGLSYRLGANLTYVDNEVTKFRGGNSPDQLYLIREGYSYKTLYGYIQEGVYQSDEEGREHMKNNGYMPTAGDLKYKDVNGDGKLDYQDKQEIGNTIPKFTYGINGELNWKNFDLNFQFSGIGKVTGYTQNQWTEPLSVSGGSITKRWRDAWTPENHSDVLPHIKVNDSWNRQESSFWACNMSWFKLKNIQLGYTVPKSVVDKMSIQRLYVYLNATDVFTLVSSKYEGFDPERSTFDSGYSQYPIPRVFSLGVNVTF